MHAERLLYSICVPSLVLIAQAVFLLERGQSDREIDRETRLNAVLTPAAIQPAWVTRSSAVAQKARHAYVRSLLW